MEAVCIDIDALAWRAHIPRVSHSLTPQIAIGPHKIEFRILQRPFQYLCAIVISYKSSKVTNLIVVLHQFGLVENHDEIYSLLLLSIYLTRRCYVVPSLLPFKAFQLFVLHNAVPRRVFVQQKAPTSMTDFYPSTTMDGLKDLFPFPHLTRISGEPDYTGLNSLYKQIKANAKSIYSTLGGGVLNLKY